MTSQEFAVQNDAPMPERRVVEAEIKLPKFEAIKMPDVDLTPLRKAAEDVLLTGLGIGVLTVRGLTQAVKAAYRAGVEELEHPGPVTKAVMEAMRGKETATAEPEAALKVPVLPLEDYDDLTVEEVVSRLGGLDADGLRVIHAYESEHKGRVTVLRAIDERLETA
jgi:hypothetical protein